VATADSGNDPALDRRSVSARLLAHRLLSSDDDAHVEKRPHFHTSLFSAQRVLTVLME